MIADIADALLRLPRVLAVGMGGSQSSGLADETSDTDLYVLHEGTPPGRGERAAALHGFADEGVVRHDDTWGEEDDFHADGHLVEVMYLDPGMLDPGPFQRGEVTPNGYTTAFLWTCATMRPLADPAGHLARLHAQLTDYPEATRDRLLNQSPIELASYLEQLRKAQRRSDWTGVTNRRCALQEVWFDLLFALNRRYHPGEKRLLTHVEACQLRPPDTVERWSQASRCRADDPDLVDLLDALVVDLVGLTDAL